MDRGTITSISVTSTGFRRTDVNRHSKALSAGPDLRRHRRHKRRTREFAVRGESGAKSIVFLFRRHFPK